MKRNIAEEITNRILEDLEKGVTPWEKPWKAGAGASPAGERQHGEALQGNQCFCPLGPSHARRAIPPPLG